MLLCSFTKKKTGSVFPNLVPRVLSLAARKNPGCRWSRSSQNLGAKNKGGEEE